MPQRTRYEQIALAAIEAAETARDSQPDFCLGLHEIMVTVQARLVLALSELDRERYLSEDRT